MIATFIGGGSHRLLGILREAMAERRIFDGGEIRLHDLDAARAEAMGRMLMITPEYARIGCRVVWNLSLDAALAGAEVVGVILRAGSARTYRLGTEAARRHGFLSTDNLSPTGAFLALKGGPILLDIARRMERLCPDAWLLDFANPVAVLSGAVNHYTRIRALGVCQGFTNHQWDVSRLLGRDEQRTDLRVETAGVNHVGFIRSATLGGEDVFAMLDQRLAAGWRMPRLQRRWSDAARANIRNSVSRLREIYRKYSVLLFSTEPEGLWHFRYEEALAESLAQTPLRTRAQVEANAAREAQSRKSVDRDFHAWLDKAGDEGFWAAHADHATLGRAPHDIFVQILRGAAGIEPVRIATSRPNEGAIAGMEDRKLAEYSQVLHKRTIRAEGRYVLPAVVQGLVGALATHQTMLADAIGTGDPRLLAHALMAYPVRPYSRALGGLCRDLVKINTAELPPAFQHVTEFL